MDVGSTQDTQPLLAVNDLHVTFHGDEAKVHAVRGVTWDIRPGEVLGIVGESGSGKSVSVASILGLLPSPPAVVEGGPVMFEGRDLLGMSERELRAVRGKEIAMIFQDPMTAFNPVQTIGRQIDEAIRVHDRSVSRAAAKARSIELLTLVGVPSPEARYSQFPHEYSGGMRQRAMIAMAIANRPKLLIADEPTTALDVTIQAQILELLADLKQRLGTAILMITHDLGVIAETAERVLVMYGGEIVEEADVRTLFEDAHHPYTEGLMYAMPHITESRERLNVIPGTVPPPTAWPSGCRFRDRCRYSWERCESEHPPLYQIGAGHTSRCHLAEEPERRAHPHLPLVEQTGAAL